VRVALLGATAGFVPATLGAELEEIIVTAQKRDQSLQEVTAAVTALDDERLTSAHVNNIEDLQLLCRACISQRLQHGKAHHPRRGLEHLHHRSETGVACTDGAVVARAEAQLIALRPRPGRGAARPQGSLWPQRGRRPDQPDHGHPPRSSALRAAVLRRYNYINFEGALSGPLAGDWLLGRIAVKSEDRDGFGENPVTGNDVDDLDRKMTRAELQFNITDDFDILLTGEYYDQEDASRALKYRRDAFPGVARLLSGGCQRSALGALRERPARPCLEIDPSPRKPAVTAPHRRSRPSRW
jgi:iron complex outermembrane receptor protein